MRDSLILCASGLRLGPVLCSPGAPEARSGERKQPTLQRVDCRLSNTAPQGRKKMSSKSQTRYVPPKLRDFSPSALDKAAEKLLAALEKEWQAVANESDWRSFRDHWMARKDGVLTQINQ